MSHLVVGRNYAKEKENIHKIIEEVMSKPKLIECHIEINMAMDEITTIDFDCKVAVTGNDD